MKLLNSKIEYLLDEKKFNEALLICQDAIKENLIENLDELFFFMARIYFNQKNYSSSEGELNKIQSNKRKNARFFFLKGRVLEKLSKTEEASNSFFIALEKQPNKERYLNKYISIMNKLKKNDELYSNLCFLSDTKIINNLSIEFGKIKVLLNMSKFNLAYSCLENINNENNDEIDLINELYGDYFYGIGNTQVSLDYYNKITNKNIHTLLKIFDNSDLRDNYISENIENIYNFYFLDKQTKNLTIVFSPILDKFVLKGYEFKTSVLFISEKMFTYYTLGYDFLIEYILNIINLKKINKVTLTGSSKGSFAAINLGIGLSEKIGVNRVRSVAFSPQTELYPINNNIKKLPSYALVLKKSNSSTTIYKYLERFGSLSERIKKINADVFIIYGNDHPRDKYEAERLGNLTSVKLKPVLNYPFHTSVLLYTKKGERLKQALTNKIHIRSKDDDFFMPINNDQLIQDFIVVLDDYNYDLNKLILQD